MSVARTTAEVDYLDGGALVAPRPKRARSPRPLWALMLAGAVGAAALVAVVGRDSLINPGGWGQIEAFVAAARSPELSADFLRLVWNATLTTLAYATLGTAASLVVGAVVGVPSSGAWRGTHHGTKWTIARAALSLPRGAHEIVWGLILVNVLGADPWVAILAIGVPYGAVTARVFAELLDEAPRAPHTALRAAGATRLGAFMYATVPPARRDLLSYSFYRFECSIRSAAILGIIGAGGLGYELALSFRTLRYDEMWTLIYALMALSGAADLWSGSLRKRVAGTTEGAMAGRALLLSAVAALILVIASAMFLRPAPAALWSERTRALAGEIAAAAWPPRFGGTGELGLLEAAFDTIVMSLIAMGLATSTAIAVAFVAGSSGRGSGGVRRGVRGAAKIVLLLCRAVPPPVWALLVLFVLFPGPLPGAVALGIYNFGILGRLMTEVVDNLDDGPSDLLTASGAPATSRFLYGTLPMVAGRFAALGAYRWEMAMRETVVVGAVGAGGLGRVLTEQLRAFDFAAVSGTVFVLVALTFMVDVVGVRVRGAFR
ncbi:MAG TPA: ABC transporter permease subunit [Actinomycetota bacterium]|nr:ABC transporter permease subunit [Actinomycetota bacterium]